MFRKLHIKLTVYMGIALTFFMIFVISGIYFITKIVYEDQTRKIMEQEAIKVQIYNNDPIKIEDLITNARYKALQSRILYFGKEDLRSNYISYDKSLNILHVKGEDEGIVKNIIDFAIESLAEKKDSYNRKDIDGKTYRIYTKYIASLSTPRVIQIYENSEGENYFWMFLKTVLLLIGAIALVLLLTISYIFTGKALKPVKETWHKQKEFIADASHELRTPLTVIQTNLDVMMSDEEGTIIENEMWLDNAYSETQVMANLIDQLLTLAKVDANETKMEWLELSLTEIVENVTDNMDIMAKNKNLKMVTDIQDDVIIKGDYDKIRRLVVILVDNAIKYTEEGFVSVKLSIEKNKKVLYIQDSGLGISNDDQKRIFDRFFRSDKARNRKFGGTGLGLSIAKWIVNSHRASIDVESKIGEGSTFIVKFN
ncbi:hypothetical protein JYG23_08635 [Sedimentibacter sp. zth1]|uniref:sensor histidine kinase n=1 Tax=Sedimentibacter sp. zth1 TaxID=2816908 RepID=UPI001A920BFE|nr:ATP-binding protein [Sedimentibacter sp. zth1]QSX04773.1 hypothetical protein JYG23_08635 [Sedimentibacter sp. zth1]